MLARAVVAGTREGEKEAARGEGFNFHMLQRPGSPCGIRGHWFSSHGGSRRKRRWEFAASEGGGDLTGERDGRMPGLGARAARPCGLRDGTARTADEPGSEGDAPAGDAIRLEASDGHHDAAGLDGGNTL